MSRPTRNAGIAVAACALLASAACGGSTSTANPPKATPSPGSSPILHPFPAADQFVDKIDNPYLPLEPGTRWVYESIDKEGDERIVVTVTNRTREIEGVTATVVRDTVTEAGKVIEDTQDWYAQDVDGNVWYLGEYSEAYEDGKTSTKGSWETGVDGALPGIVMLADPQVGDSYHQEFYKGEAEDVADVLATDATTTVPYRLRLRGDGPRRQRADRPGGDDPALITSPDGQRGQSAGPAPFSCSVGAISTVFGKLNVLIAPTRPSASPRLRRWPVRRG